MLADRIRCTTATTGTGSLTLSSTGVRDATNGDCLAPAEYLSVLGNQLIPYFLISGNNWAQGFGSLSSDGLTLTRDVNEIRWNGSTYAAGLLSLTGTSTVFLSPRAVTLSAADVGRSLAARAGAHFC